jgi:glyoxylase-like metal-dependent hydrolase (beta-lactamase superfamily II)
MIMVSTEIQYRVYVSAMQELPPTAGIQLPNGQTPYWSPMASTLIFGPTETVLTDPPVTIEQATRLATWVENIGRPLSAIYITHGHGDHWFGAKTLVERFSAAKVYATAAVITEMQRSTANERTSLFWETSFPGQIGETPILAQPVPANGLSVDG